MLWQIAGDQGEETQARLAALRQLLALGMPSWAADDDHPDDDAAGGERRERLLAVLAQLDSRAPGEAAALLRQIAAELAEPAGS